MKRTAIDERALRTRNQIARAIIGLGQHRPIDSIRVSELASAAGIGRSTFYAHYASLGDYLCRSFGAMVERNALHSADQLEGADQPLPVAAILDHVERAGAYVAAVQRSRHRPEMFAEGERRLRLLAEARLVMLAPKFTPGQRAATAAFISAGFIVMLRAWMERGMERPADLLRADFEDAVSRLLGA